MHGIDFLYVVTYFLFNGDEGQQMKDQPFETSLASFAIGVAVTNRLGGGGLLFFVLVESLWSCRGPHTESRPPMTWRRRARDRLESNGRDPFLI